MYTRWTLRCKIFSCTCTHAGRYVVRSCSLLLSQVKKKGLTQAETQLFRDLVRQGCCKETPHVFVMVGGDQVAESLASITKSQLRRHGLSRNVSDPIEHRNVLSVHYIHKNPGLSSIMSALARFRKYAKLPTHPSVGSFLTHRGNEKI